MERHINVDDYVLAVRIEKERIEHALGETPEAERVRGQVVGIEDSNILLVRTERGAQVSCYLDGAKRIGKPTLKLILEQRRFGYIARSAAHPMLEGSGNRSSTAAIGTFILKHADALGIEIIRA